MPVARTYWQVTREGHCYIFDLYATVNTMYRRFQTYQMSPNRYSVIAAFLEDLRYTVAPDLAMWEDVPSATGVNPPLPAESWLILYAERYDLIDLTLFEYSDTEPETETDTDDEDIDSLLI